MDDIEAITAAASRWAAARHEREQATIVDWAGRWAERHRVEADITERVAVTGCLPSFAAGSRFPVVTAGARGARYANPLPV